MKLRMILSEMPVRHFKAAGSLPGSRRSFEEKSYEGYTSPKYMNIVSEKLSRLSGYNINIFIIDTISNKLTPDMRIEELAKLTGVPVNELEDAINFIMSGNRGQIEFSPWLYMHQLGEAITEHYQNIYGLDEDDPDDDLEYAIFGQATGIHDRLHKLIPDNWHYRLKMGSARKAKAEHSVIEDLFAELLTEYMWHGGRIRFDYPENVDKREIDEVLNLIYFEFKTLLDGCVGKILFNATPYHPIGGTQVDPLYDD